MSDFNTRDEPPKKPEEWRHIREGVEKAHKTWPVAKPFVAAVDNWKGIAVIAGIVSFLRGPEIINAISTYLGIGL